MSNLKNVSNACRVVAANVMLVLLVGCGSTSPNTVEKYEQIEPLEIHSVDELVWNESKSKALNFASMGNKAGLGRGLRDSFNPTEGVQSSESNKLLDFATGFLAMDIGTGIAVAFNENQRDKEIRWSPFIVDLVKFDGNVNDRDSLAQVAMDQLFKKFSKGLEGSDYKSSTIGVFSDNNPLGMITSRIVLEGNICRDGSDYLMPADRKGVAVKLRHSNMIIGLENKDIDINNTCGFEVGSSVVGKVGEYLVVVHEIVASNLNVYVAKQLGTKTGMAIVFPEYLEFHHASDMQERYTFKYDFPYVAYNGENLLFDARESSKSPF